jgi:hypothetical protein
MDADSIASWQMPILFLLTLVLVLKWRRLDPRVGLPLVALGASVYIEMILGAFGGWAGYARAVVYLAGVFGFCGLILPGRVGKQSLGWWIGGLLALPAMLVPGIELFWMEVRGHGVVSSLVVFTIIRMRWGLLDLTAMGSKDRWDLEGGNKAVALEPNE